MRTLRDAAAGAGQSWPVQVLIALAIVALIYHFCNGLRHLAWDMGWGFERRAGARERAPSWSSSRVLASAICIYFLFRHGAGSSMSLRTPLARVLNHGAARDGA